MWARAWCDACNARDHNIRHTLVLSWTLIVQACARTGIMSRNGDSVLYKGTSLNKLWIACAQYVFVGHKSSRPRKIDPYDRQLVRLQAGFLSAYGSLMDNSFHNAQFSRAISKAVDTTPTYANSYRAKLYLIMAVD